MLTEILVEAKRLYDLGCAVHWIKEHSKAPVKTGWSGDTRDDWDTVLRDYRHGYGLGVRLGAASALGSVRLFLANIDVDIKSDDQRHRDEALALLEKRFPGVKAKAPWVRTGYGYRFFVRTLEPVASGKIGTSAEECVVYMPTSETNRRQHAAVAEGRLTAVQLNDGYRVRPAWELELMSAGKQVVLPPSIHPDTGKKYEWGRGFKSGDELPLIQATTADITRPRGRPRGSTVVQNFKPVVVDLIGSILTDRIVDMIIKGQGVSDRSAACFSACIAMLKAKFTHDEIISVLTDRSLYLGETAYDHRKTDSRAAAAAWIRDYCLAKAVKETDAASVFAAVATVTPTDEENESETADAAELTAAIAAEPVDWRQRLRRCGKDGEGIKPCLENVVLVLRNAAGEDIFKRDSFADRDSYGRKAPWFGGVKGKALTDSDAVHIKHWLARKWGFEPAVQVVFEAMTALSERNSFHPVREELEALPIWDNVPRIDTWLKRNFRARGPAEYLAQVFRKWLVASITRVYKPGFKFDWMPIFEGKQGTGKSSFGAILFGQKYFTDWLPDLADKDAALALQGMRCVEFGELDRMRRNEVETVKQFVTRQVDKLRPPYGRKSIEVYRQSVFFGTTNKETYFRDDTGNRRFNPVEVGMLDFDALERDRDQLWAEALFIYSCGLERTLYLEGEAAIHAVAAQLSKMVPDESSLMTERLLDRINHPENLFDFTRFKIADLFENGPFSGKWVADIRNTQFAAKTMRDFWRTKSGFRFDNIHTKKGNFWEIRTLNDFLGN